MEWGEVDWSGMKWNEDWSGVEWSEVDYSRAEWIRVNSSGIK